MFQEATFDETHQAFNSNQSPRSAAADEKLVVQFTIEPWQDRPKSAAEGRPIFVEREYIMIMVPGDQNSIIHRPASQMDIDRFPIHYQRFKNKQEQRFGSGTPLRAVTFLSMAQTKELEFFNVFTVEQLAAMPDVHAQKFMGAHRLKQMANDFLAAARDQAPLTAMREEMAKKDEQLAAQAQALEEMSQRLKALEDRNEAA